MFDLEIGDELELLVQTARSFAGEELTPALRDFESARAVDEKVRRSFAQIGLAAPTTMWGEEAEDVRALADGPDGAPGTVERLS